MKAKELKEGMKAVAGGHVNIESKDKVKTREAILHLESKGFFVANLWQVSDVQQDFECTDDEAFDVLHDALTNEYITERIFIEISDYATMNGLVEKTDK